MQANNTTTETHTLTQTFPKPFKRLKSKANRYTQLKFGVNDTRGCRTGLCVGADHGSEPVGAAAGPVTVARVQNRSRKDFLKKNSKPFSSFATGADGQPLFEDEDGKLFWRLQVVKL